MKLLDLHPKWHDNEQGEHEHLIFDCPKCGTHQMDIPVFKTRNAWKTEGEDFETITLSPSILHKCYDADFIGGKGEGQPRYCESHFFIRSGEIINA